MGGNRGLPGADTKGDQTSGTPRRIAPVLDQKVQDAIGRSLKAHYEDLVNAPVPDRLLALLEELEAKEGERDR